MTTRIVIDRLGAKGDGIGKDGTFITGGLPGETVEGEVIDGRLSTPRIIEPSSERVRPPCPHGKSCGGCVLQHASDKFVANWKVDQVRIALARVGLTPHIKDILISPPRSRRRAALSGRRVKSGAIVGFHSRSSNTVVATPNCQLLTNRLMNSVPALEEITKKFGSRRGELTFHITDTTTGIDVDVEGGPELDSSGIQSLAAIAERADFARLTWDRDEIATRRPPKAKVGETLVPIPPRAFLQATEEGQKALIDAAMGIVEGHPKIIDLFSGAGTFSIPAASHAEVHAIEGDTGLCKALDAGWRHATGLKLITTEVRDLFRNPVLAEDLEKYSAAIIDPPRAGAESQVRQISVSNVEKIAFISCNPVTFARDALILVDKGFTCDWVRPIDQFRWSSHIELVSSFSRS